MKAKIGKQGKVLEIGSYNINGSIRHWFNDADEYVGIDAKDGEGVDIVMWSYDIHKKWSKGYFDCVVCCETLEHDPFFWKTLKEINRVLKKDGWLVISAPGRMQELHEYPVDMYRFMPQSFTMVLFAGYTDLMMGMGHSTDRDGNISSEPVTIAACGRKQK